MIKAEEVWKKTNSYKGTERVFTNYEDKTESEEEEKEWDTEEEDEENDKESLTRIEKLTMILDRL